MGSRSRSPISVACEFAHATVYTRPLVSHAGSSLMKTSKAALVFCTLLVSFPGLAQVALKPDTPSLLFWTPEQQATGYRNIEKIYTVTTVKRGATVHSLPKAAKQVSPEWDFAGRHWTVADYMSANRTSGVLVLKNGK